MKRMLLTSLLAVGALTGAIGTAQAECYVHYFPKGWYVAKGPCWVRWHGYYEPWQPPSPTNWTVNNPLPPCVQTPAGGAEILFHPIGYYPPAPLDDGGWYYGKHVGQKPSLRQLIPERQPAYLP